MESTSPGVVLVTGAAKRIGRAIAVALAHSGWAVAAHFNRSRDDAERLVEEMIADGARAVAVRADLSREDEAAALVAAATEALGPLTCLVNNASRFERDCIESTTREVWDLHMETNLRAPFLLSQAFARQLPDDATGNIVNILDQRVWNLTPHFLSYTVSKSALWTLTRTLALALAPRIRVNAIGPGPTLPSPRQSASQFDRQRRQTPLNRGATPAEIAQAVQFLLAAPAMTGQMLALDGGQHLGWRSDEQNNLPEE